MGQISRTEIEARFAKYRDLLSDQWDSFCAAFQTPLFPTIWVNPARSTPEKLLQSLHESEYPASAIDYIPGGIQIQANAKLGRRIEYRSGHYHTQEAASMLPPIVLNPQPGERVLDLCAAPGGKSAQISLMMEGQGTLVVNDLSFSRLRALRATQERLGLVNMVLCAQEGQSLLKDHPPCFDRVLVDAPCSCEGTLRKAGRWNYTTDEQHFKDNLIGVQKALLLNAIRLTRAGGVVVYSTCTLDPRENEAVVAAVLAQTSHVELEPIQLDHFVSDPGITEWQGQRWSESLANTIRVYPHRNDTGGFYIARLRVGSQNIPHNDQGTWQRASYLAAKKSTDTDRLSKWLQYRFGVSMETLGPLTLIQGNVRSASALSASLELPPTRYEVAGLPLFHTRGRVPHLTSSGHLLVGQYAQKNTIQLSSPTEVDLYYRGKTFHPRQLTNVPQHGDTIVRYRDFTLGGGFWRSEQQELESQYPKAFRLVETASAFEGPITFAEK